MKISRSPRQLALEWIDRLIEGSDVSETERDREYDARIIAYDLVRTSEQKIGQVAQVFASFYRVWFPDGHQEIEITAAGLEKVGQVLRHGGQSLAAWGRWEKRTHQLQSDNPDLPAQLFKRR